MVIPVAMAYLIEDDALRIIVRSQASPNALRQRPHGRGSQNDILLRRTAIAGNAYAASHSGRRELTCRIALHAPHRVCRSPVCLSLTLRSSAPRAARSIVVPPRRRNVSDGLEAPSVVEPVDPFEGCELDRLEAAPATRSEVARRFV